MTKISFPGLNIEEFTLDPVAFTLFGKVEVRWYALFIVTGMILAFIYATQRAKKAGVTFDDMLDMMIFTIIFGIVGARLFYVLTSLDKYDSFYDVIAIWEGGLAIYGGLIAGALTIFVVCKIKKLSFLTLFDSVAPGVMIAQAIGRWGNFFNGEAYGGVVSEDSPLYFIRMGLYPHDIEGVYGTAFVHPTFLYESLWNILGFIIINLTFKHKKFKGQIFYSYIAWYGFGRMFIEGLRTDSLYVGVFRISQVIGFVCFIVGALMLTLGLLKARRDALTALDYEPAYPKFVTTASMGTDKADEADVEAQAQTETVTEAEAEAETESEDTPQYTDVSDKINRLFDKDDNNG